VKKSGTKRAGAKHPGPFHQKSVSTAALLLLQLPLRFL
jgi:hypothetical protein